MVKGKIYVFLVYCLGYKTTEKIVMYERMNVNLSQPSCKRTVSIHGLVPLIPENGGSLRRVVIPQQDFRVPYVLNQLETFVSWV